MTISQVQAKNNSSGVFAGITSQTCRPTSNLTANNLIVVSIQCGLNSGGASSADPTSVSSAIGNTYQKVVAAHAPAGSNPSDGYLYFCAKSNAGAETVTVTFGASQSFISVTVHEFKESTGSPNGWAVDKTGTAASGNTSGSTTATLSGVSHTPYVAVGGNANWTNAPTAGTGYTLGPANSAGIFTGTEFIVASVTPTVSVLWGSPTSAPNSTTVGANFYVASAPSVAWLSPSDVYVPRRWRPHDPMAASLIPGTLPPAVGIDGMAWFTPPDDLPRKPRPPADLPAWDPQAFAAQSTAISMAWFAPRDQDAPPRPVGQPPPAFTLSPPALLSRIQGDGWRNPPDVTLPKSRPPADVPAWDPQSVPAVGISGEAWFAPPDLYPPRPPYRQPPPAAVIVPPALISLIQGDGWRNPLDIYVPRRWQPHDPMAASLTPATLPVSIAGIAWFEPFDELPRKLRLAPDIPAWDPQSFAASVGVAGMAWFAPLDELPRRPRPAPDVPAWDPQVIVTQAVTVSIAWFVARDQDPPRPPVRQPPPPAVIVPPGLVSLIQGDGWRNPGDIYPPRRWQPHDPMAASLTPATLPAAIAGMAWFEPFDELPPRKPRPPADVPAWDPQAFAAQSTIAGMAWFAPRDQDPPRPPYRQPPAAAVIVPPALVSLIQGDGWRNPPDIYQRRRSFDHQPGLVLTPATLPVAVSGIGWFAPRDRDPPRPPYRQPPPAATLIPPAALSLIQGDGWRNPLDVYQRRRWFDHPPALVLTSVILPVTFVNFRRLLANDHARVRMIVAPAPVRSLANDHVRVRSLANDHIRVRVLANDHVRVRALAKIDD